MAGNRLLYEFCAKNNVPHRNCGKLVVAHGKDQEGELEHLAANGRANGVEGLRLVDRDVQFVLGSRILKRLARSKYLQPALCRQKSW